MDYSDQPRLAKPLTTGGARARTPSHTPSAAGAAAMGMTPASPPAPRVSSDVRKALSPKRHSTWARFGSPRASATQLQQQQQKQERNEEIEGDDGMTGTLDGRLPLIGLKHLEKWESKNEEEDSLHERQQHQHSVDHQTNQRPSFIETLNKRRTLLLQRLDGYTGLGTAFFLNGDSYSGNWRNGLQHNHGVYVFKFGDVYDGDWVEGKATGHAIVRLSDGRRYKGDMCDFERQGYGTMLYLNGGRFEGQWERNRKCGKGLHKSKNGASYQGQWKNNQRSGSGVYVNPETGIYYNGRWLLDKPHGLGEYRGPRGLRYRSFWKRGVPQGEGTITMSDGKYFSGQMTDGIPNGFGTMLDPYGSTFSGTWAGGRPTNDGAYQTPEGSMYGGTWNEGSWELSYGLINTEETKEDVFDKHSHRNLEWTLTTALENPCARSLLIKYGQRCLQIENVWFLLRCQALEIRHLQSGSPELDTELNAIMADFISKSAYFEVNVAGHQREECVAKINRGGCSLKDCLGDIRQEIFRMLEQNLWAHFRESNDYAEMCEIERFVPAGGDLFSYQQDAMDPDTAFDFTLT